MSAYKPEQETYWLTTNPFQLSKANLIKSFRGARVEVSPGEWKVCNFNSKSTKDEIASIISSWQINCKRQLGIRF